MQKSLSRQKHEAPVQTCVLSEGKFFRNSSKRFSQSFVFEEKDAKHRSWDSSKSR